MKHLCLFQNTAVKQEHIFIFYKKLFLFLYWYGWNDMVSSPLLFVQVVNPPKNG